MSNAAKSGFIAGIFAGILAGVISAVIILGVIEYKINQFGKAMEGALGDLGTSTEQVLCDPTIEDC